MASECKRSILSCSRCRKRKMRCDRQLPSCSQCIAVKANCTGISSSANTDVPRSIVQHLECEIARLETELLQDGQLEVVQASDILVQMPSSQPLDTHSTATGPPASNRRLPILPPRRITTATSPSPPSSSPLRTSILSSASLQAMVAATLPYDSGATDLLSRVRMGMTPSAAEIGEKKSSRSAATNSANKASRSSHLLEPMILRSIPSDIVQRLIGKYLNTIHRESPFLVAAEVVEQFANVARVLGWSSDPKSQLDTAAPTAVPASHDFLIVYLILAISVTLGSANDGHEERCMALSISLFEEGIQHLYGLPSVPADDVERLQTILLVLLYATVCPRSANVWVLSGVAMRTCLELGMHREPPDYMALDPDVIQTRRRVFWAAYCMDRSICSALQLPLTTPDEAISTALPASLNDPPFHGSVVYHRLLSEILHVHFHGEPIPPGFTWEDWLASMKNHLQAWSQSRIAASAGTNLPSSSASSSSSTPSLSPPSDAEFRLARGLMMLHRPSPRVPFPSPSSLLAAFESATSAERIHSQHIRSGFFRRPWLSAHHTREGATVVLFCLRHGYDTIVARYSAAKIFDMTKLFTSNLLAIATHGWPEVSVYAGIYERLLGPLLERAFFRNAALTDQFGPVQDAELMRLLYPGPAHLDSLRFGIRQPKPPQEEFGPFDFNLFMGDDDAWATDLGLGLGLGDPSTVASVDEDTRWDMSLPAVDVPFGIS